MTTRCGLIVSLVDPFTSNFLIDYRADLEWELQDLSLSPVSGLGPDIDDFWCLNGLLLPQSPSEKVGGEGPHRFQLVLHWEGAA